MESKEIAEKSIWALRLDPKRAEGCAREMAQSKGENDVCLASNCGSSHMAIFGVVGHGCDEGHIIGNKRVLEYLIHLTNKTLGTNFCCLACLNQITPHFLQYLISPAHLIQFVLGD